MQSVKCKTIEIDTDDDRKPGKKPGQKKADDSDHVHGEDSSSEEDDTVDFNDKNDDEISSKLVFIKQELKLQGGGAANVDGSSSKNIFWIDFFLFSFVE